MLSNTPTSTTEATLLSSRFRLLLLQHPSEARNPLSTTKLVASTVKGAVHKVGLSWPSLSKALGEPAENRHWAVLYLGALKDAKKFREDLPFQLIGRKGTKVPLKDLQGLVILDGNWKQAKTLWWRNPWLLRLQRAVLNTSRSSQYGDLRRQPRKNCLSTIEAVAESLTALGEPENGETLHQAFASFLATARS
jgi:DTW domain-containing protein YfiP